MSKFSLFSCLIIPSAKINVGLSSFYLSGIDDKPLFMLHIVCVLSHDHFEPRYRISRIVTASIMIILHQPLCANLYLFPRFPGQLASSSARIGRIFCHICRPCPFQQQQCRNNKSNIVTFNQLIIKGGWQK